MDGIFAKCDSVFTVVGIAKRQPRRFDKNGELLIKYDQTDMARRRSSATAASIARPDNTKEKDTEQEEYV